MDSEGWKVNILMKVYINEIAARYKERGHPSVYTSRLIIMEHERRLPAYVDKHLYTSGRCHETHQEV